MDTKKSQNITTSIPFDYWETATTKGWKWNEALMLGINAKKAEEEWGMSFWQKVSQMTEKCANYAKKCQDLEENLAKLKEILGQKGAE